MTDKQQQGKPQAQGGDITHPPFPNRMTFSDMYDTLFNRDFMTQEEFKTICDAAEMYANGCLKHAAELGYQLAPTEVQKEESAGVQLIAAERRRQIEVEGWTSERDAGYEDLQLVFAAIAYAIPADIDEDTLNRKHFWPWHKSWWKPSPNDRIKELKKAGALIAAEIDRLQNIKS